MNKRKPNYRNLLRRAIAIIEEERDVMVESCSLGDGTVPDPDDRKIIRSLNSWLKQARKAVAA